MYLVLDPTTGRETSSGGVGGVCAGKMLTLALVLRNDVFVCSDSPRRSPESRI